MGKYVVCNNELYHHGIKGMKWGVRRFQNKDGSLTPYGRERAKTLKKDGFDRVSDKDNLKIAKGTSLYRISTKQAEQTDTRYLSFRNNDRNFYKGYWGRQLRADKPDSKLYEHVYEAASDIFIPSAKTRRTMLSKLLDDPEVIKSICRDDFGQPNKQMENNLSASASHWTTSKRANYISKWLGHRPDILAKYGEMIVSTGFNATIDDNGRTVGEMPLILFTSNSTLHKQKSEKIDRFIEEHAQMLYSSIDAKKYRRKTASI